jgi:excisionase family DNA binding protein
MDTRSRSATDTPRNVVRPSSHDSDDRRGRLVERLSAQLAAAIVEASGALLLDEPPPEAIEKLISVREAADRLGVARSTAYLLIASGELRTVKLRKRRMVPAGEIVRLVRGAAGSGG